MQEWPFEELAKAIRISRFKESCYAVIDSYMDESFDMRQSGIFAVGGLLARGTAIFELERAWKALRKRPDIGIKYFKASQCERGTGEFSKFVADEKNITPAERERLDSISHEFLKVIVDPRSYGNYRTLAGIGIVQEDFYDVIQDANARAILGDNPYRLAYDLAMIQCARAMKGLEKPDRVSYVCDQDEEHSALASDAYDNLTRTNPDAAKYMASFSKMNEKECDPLQAADAVVFEIRRALNLELGQRKGYLRKQFEILDDAGAVFLIQYADKANLLRIVATHKPGEPFNLDVIMEQKFDRDMKVGFRKPS